MVNVDIYFKSGRNINRSVENLEITEPFIKFTDENGAEVGIPMRNVEFYEIRKP